MQTRNAYFTEFFENFNIFYEYLFIKKCNTIVTDKSQSITKVSPKYNTIVVGGNHHGTKKTKI